MKRSISCFFSLVICFSADSQTPSEDFSLSLNFKTPIEGQIVIGYRPDEGPGFQLDSAIVKNQAVAFHGKIKEPTVLSLFIGSNEYPDIAFIIEPEKMSADIALTPDSTYSLSNKIGMLIDIEADKILANMKLINDSIFANVPDSMEYEFYDSMHWHVVVPQYEIELQAYVQKNNRSMAALLLLQDLFSFDEDNYTPVENIFNAFDTSVQNSMSGKEVKSFIETSKRTSVNAKATDFSLTNNEGKVIRLSSLKGKYVLLDFWATWCGPCRAESPHLVAAYEKYKKMGFEIVSVSIDENRESWKKAVKRDHYSWINLIDRETNPISELYGVESIPKNWLLNKEGVIIDKNLRGEELEEKLKKVFN